MLNKNILCGALALLIMSPVLVNAADNTIVSTTVVQSGLSDAEITAKIKALFALSPLVKGVDISVLTADKNVVLEGKVKTDLEYDKAVSLAQSVDGVNDVDVKKLMVESSRAPISDTYITAKAKGIMMKEKLFGDKDVEFWPVSIETKNAVVYLVGAVDTDEQRTNVVNLVKSIHGVKSVDSTLTVKKQAE